MRILKDNFNRIILKVTLASALLFTLSCGDDESNEITATPDSEPEVNQQLTSEVEKFVENGNKTYRISQAILSNSEVSDLEITSLFNIRDDEFVFSTEGNGDLAVAWHEGFGFNATAINEAAVMSDARASSKITPLIFNNDTVSYDASGFSFSEQNGVVSGILNLNGGATLTIELQEKLASDYLQPPTSLDTAEELFSFTGGSVWSGFTGTISQNSLFLINPVWNPSNGQTRAFKFDLNTNSLSSFTYSQEFAFWNNLDIIEDKIYNTAGSSYQIFDLDFEAVLDNVEITNSQALFGAAGLDEDIYLFGGWLDTHDSSQIGIYRTGSNQVQIIGNLSDFRSDFTDGEIVNNKLYIFGGNTGEFLPSYDNYIFDITTESIEVFSSPTRRVFTSTVTVENLIYVGGMTEEDFNNDGVPDSFNPFLEVYNIQNNISSPITINFELLEGERLYRLWASEDFIYLVLSQNQTDGSANVRVVRSPLN